MSADPAAPYCLPPSQICIFVLFAWTPEQATCALHRRECKTLTPWKNHLSLLLVGLFGFLAGQHEST